jgi:hypothetical protein
MYWFGALFLILREEHRPRMFEKRMLRRIFGPKRDEVTGGGENCIMRRLITLSSSSIELG